ncbi:hypothetical protein GOPIP_019_00080 [Gordonia polyisoprenivorans NBRC 16320 = JCM 10675]|uniref:DUF4435 domain-containing protein n=1 Tax=Gordonia polyisoprenivorans TaxID=84595 RepID=A0A846WRS9_9ACTN|nr:hypothetical protein [Gordonia polyisoprenivorans]NKY04269.1 hypothetical protein [Gordonia polyisoprenivorans]GAB21973.1 hypothetical protein GOPIP_019_00080 [Gordonia polyisoprenivorans NBRC 16320 = JCM 10675]
MIEYLNSNTLFNEIAMIRPELKGMILVVEGSDDEYTMDYHTGASVTVIGAHGGKREVLEASIKADQYAIPSAYFLVDSDYDDFVPTEVPYGTRVVTSDGHDFVMDLVLVDQSVMQRVLGAHLRTATAGTGVRISASELIQKGLALAFVVGVLRLLSVKHQWGLKLRDFPFGKLRSIEPRVDEIVRIALNNSPPITEDTIDLARILASALNDYRDQSTAIVGDHDYFSATAHVLKLAGLANVKGSTLATSFIAAVHCRAIGRTGWYSDLSSRSKEESGESCFACPCEESA